MIKKKVDSTVTLLKKFIMAKSYKRKISMLKPFLYHLAKNGYIAYETQSQSLYWSDIYEDLYNEEL